MKISFWGTTALIAVGAIAATTNTNAQEFKGFLLNPKANQGPIFADEFDANVGDVLIDTFAVTNSANHPDREGTQWMGSAGFVIANDPLFGTGNIVTRTADSNESFPGVLTCLPWEIDNGDNNIFNVQAQVWMPPKSDDPEVTNSVSVGFFDNADFNLATLEDGRGALWLELFYSDTQQIGSHEAHYRVRGKDENAIFDLYDSSTTGETIDLSNGFATTEIAWGAFTNESQRSFGAAVMDADGTLNLIDAINGGIAGDLSRLDNNADWVVHGVGVQMAGVGGMVGNFAAVPEPSSIALAAIAGFGLLLARRRKAA